MKIKLPYRGTITVTPSVTYGNSVDIQEPVYPEYQIGRKYRFKITDKWGWDISKSVARDMRISNVLDEKSNGVLYHLYLIRPGDTPTAWIDLDKSELKINGEDIRIRFKCKSLIEAEQMIDMILEPNELKVAPVNLLK